MVIVEAMAAGVAVVTANCDGVLDIVADGRDGCLVDPRDTEALTAAVAALADDPQRRRRLAESGRQRALRDFTEAQMYRKLGALYADLIARRRSEPAERRRARSATNRRP